MIFYDKNNRQICPGDLLKSYHFTGARKKKYWLYHVAVNLNERLFMVPVCHLEPSKISGGGKCMMSEDMAKHTEIIYGSGPGDILSYDDRPKRKQS